MVRHQDETARWQTSHGFEEILSQVLLTPPEIVKSSALKKVTRHQFQGRTFYIKRYLHQGKTLRPAKFFMKSSQGRQEWRLAVKLAHLEVPVVPHLAYGERWSWRGLLESILITEGLSSFGAIDEESIKTALFQEAFGKFVRRLHDHGVIQDDFHRENLLYSKLANTFCLVDLDGIEVYSSVFTRRCFFNICLIDSFLPLMPPFFEGYGQFSERHQEIQERSRIIRRSRLPGRARRALKENRDFQQICTEGFKWSVRRRFLSENLSKVLADPDAFVKSPASVSFGPGEGLLVESFDGNGRGGLQVAFLKPPPGIQNFLKSIHLELAGVPTLKSIAGGVSGSSFFRGQSYLVRMDLPARKELADLEEDKGKVIRMMAHLMARLHQEGFSHPNLRLESFAFSAAAEVFLSDLNNLVFLKEVGNSRAVQNLSQLARSTLGLSGISRMDRTRFLVHYTKLREIQDKRWWWNQLNKLSATRPDS